MRDLPGQPDKAPFPASLLPSTGAGPDLLRRTAFALLLSSAGASAVGILFWVLGARLYSARAVGENAALISAMQFVAAPAWVAQYSVLIRFLPRAGERSGGLIAGSYALAIGGAMPLAVLVALVGPEVFPALEVLSSSAGWTLGFAVCVALWSVFALQDAALTALRRAEWVPAENITYAVAKLALLAVFVGTLPAWGVFTAWNLPLVVMVVLVNLLLFRRLVPLHPRSVAAPPEAIRTLASYGAANWAGTLLALMPLTLLPVLVASELGARENAWFYIPFSIAVGLSLVTTSTSTAMTVEGAYDAAALTRILRASARHTAVLLLPPLAVACVGAPLVLGIFGSDYAEHGSTVLRLLALAAIPNAVVQFSVGVARVLRKTRAILVTQGLMAGITITLTLVLMPGMGIDGPAVAWLVGQCTAAAVGGFWVLVPLRRAARSV